MLLAAAVLGIVLGTVLGLRNSSLFPTQPGQAGARPTIVIARPSTPAAPAAAPSPSPARSPVPAQAAQQEQEYVVQPGDTMRSIAQQVYGDAEQWPRIYDANRDIIGPDPDALQVGMRLRVPAS